MNKRIQWIDLCKALGIYLVVFGHFLPVGTPLKVIIYSFHVPLFFILSGYLLKTNRSWIAQIRHSVRSLLIPYFGFAAVSVIYYVIFPANIMEIIPKFFFWRGETIWNEPLWFLFTLFVVDLIAYTLLCCLSALNKKPHTIPYHTILTALTIGALTMGYLIYWLRPPALSYFGLDKALCLLGFYLLGYLLRKTQFVDVVIPKVTKGIWIGLFMFSCIIALIFNWNNNISVYFLDLNNYFVFLTTSILSSICLIAVTQDITVHHSLKSVSRYTIFIMGTHYMFIPVYMWIATKMPMDSMLFCLPIIAIYTIVLDWWDKRRPVAIMPDV
jgi:fucose 4-O-acetylase-like acetyltransferase